VLLDSRHSSPARTLTNLGRRQRELMACMAKNTAWVTPHNLFRTDLRIAFPQVNKDVDATCYPNSWPRIVECPTVITGALYTS
jgi:hypothetical protein